MCLNLSLYPLIENTTLSGTTKKQIVFGVKHLLTDRNSLSAVSDFKRECRLATLNSSKFSHFNKLLNGKKIIDFKMVPCGVCPECLKAKARDTATRIMLEAKNSQHNYFVTFTYDDQHLPDDRMLDPKAISKLNKKIKIYLKRINKKSNFRFYGVGEYGTHSLRPHYHVIYFNLDLPDNDLTYYKTTSNGDILYNSKFLSKVWSNGYVVVGEVTTGSACYVARYCDKKKILTKEQKLNLIKKNIVPEYASMSRRPGIGASSTPQMFSKIALNGSISLPRGQTAPVPRYFIKKYKDSLSCDLLDSYEQSKKRLISQFLDSNMYLAEHASKDLDTFLSLKTLKKRKEVL